VAPEGYHLGLLPSGPDPVRRPPPHRTQPSTPAGETVPLTAAPQEGIQPRYSGLRVQGTASSPSSTTTRMVTHGPSFVKAGPRYLLAMASAAYSERDLARFDNSSGRTNLVAGPEPRDLSVSRYSSLIVLPSILWAAS